MSDEGKAERLAMLHIFLEREPDRAAAVAEMSRVAGISEGAAVATALCFEALRDYCPDAERSRVTSLLIAAHMKGLAS